MAGYILALSNKEADILLAQCLIIRESERANDLPRSGRILYDQIIDEYEARKEFEEIDDAGMIHIYGINVSDQDPTPGLTPGIERFIESQEEITALVNNLKIALDHD